jgi:Methyltransferase domain
MMAGTKLKNGSVYNYYRLNGSCSQQQLLQVLRQKSSIYFFLLVGIFVVVALFNRMGNLNSIVNTKVQEPKIKQLDDEILNQIQQLDNKLVSRMGFNNKVSLTDSPSVQQYDLAYNESFGFFDDITNDHWIRMKDKSQSNGIFLYPDNPGRMNKKNSLLMWLLNNADPTFTCPHIQRVGGKGDGPKWTCDPHRIIQTNTNTRKNDCLIYSIGSNGNYKFESGLIDIVRKEKGNINDTSCEIHVFDPSPDYGRTDDPTINNIHYHAIGLKSSKDNKSVDTTSSGLVFKSFPDIIKMLGHEERHIDIFKIDCEGCEFETYYDWLAADIGQVLVEIHTRYNKNKIAQFFFDMYTAGYEIFSKEANTHPGATKHGVYLYEYGFIKLHQSFHKKMNYNNN